MLPAEPMDMELVDIFSKLSHVTSLRCARSILKCKRIAGTDALKHANFGLRSLIRGDLAKNCEVILYFDWEGENAILDSVYFGDYSIWPEPPKRNIAYHIKTQSIITKGYWQTNIYGCDRGLKFVEAKAFRNVEPKYINLFRILPRFLYRWIDEKYGSFDKLNSEAKELSKYAGTYLEV